MGSPIRRGSSPAAAGPSAAVAAPTQPSTKAAVATPKLNSEMEMGSLPVTDAAQPEGDIMQLARVGDVGAMEKLFESGEYDATFADDEGITPLHVRPPSVGGQKRS